MVDGYRKLCYVTLKKLFTETEIKKYRSAMIKAIKSRQNPSFWNNIQGDDKRQYKEMAQFPFTTDGKEMIEKLVRASGGILHEKLQLTKAMLLRSLKYNVKQRSHIDAANENLRGCSVIISIMPNTYMINYMNDTEIDIDLDIGDVLIFSNAFKHGGGSYDIANIPEEHKMVVDKKEAHYRAFLSYEHQDDDSNSKRVTFRQV
jgi:hypothetical protein